jgi:NitT/TauT family transport system substrate-binding protein
VIPQVAAGRSAFGIADASSILAARAQQVPVVAVFAALQHNPRCILVHDSGPRSLAELRDITLAMNVREPFSQFLQKQVGLPGVSVVPYTGNVAPFLADPNMAQQAYVFSEPIVVARQGVAARCLSVADLGFDPYAGVVITSEAMLAEQPDRVRSFIAAVTTGWERYLRDPGPAHAEIHAHNPEMTLETMTSAAAALAPLAAVAGGRPGAMTPARWQLLADQLAELGVIAPGSVDPTGAFTTAFLPGV